MRKRSKVLLAALVATLLLTLAVTAASPNRMSVSDSRFRVTWSALSFSSEVVIVRCLITLEGSFHSRTFAKVAGALIGFVTRIGEHRSDCFDGTSLLLETLPWHVRYRSFAGTLPVITSMRVGIVPFSFSIEPTLEARCLYASTTAQAAVGTYVLSAPGVVTEFRMDETAQIPLARGGLLCPSQLALGGTGSMTLLGSTVRITVRLI